MSTRRVRQRVAFLSPAQLAAKRARDRARKAIEYAADPEKFKAKARERYAGMTGEERPRYLIDRRAYREANRERIREVDKAYRSRNVAGRVAGKAPRPHPVVAYLSAAFYRRLRREGGTLILIINMPGARVQ